MIDQFLLGDFIQVIVSSIIKKVNQKTKNFLYRNKNCLSLQSRKTLCSTLIQCHFDYACASPRLLCSSAVRQHFFFARAMGRQRALHKENNGFASPTLGRHISTFCGNQILFSIRNPYINRFTNHFSIHS